MTYFGELRTALEQLETPHATDLIAELASTITGSDMYVCICGNGGSAAIANHFAADVCKVMGVRSVTSLCDSTSMLTALANDISYEQVFTEQLKMQVKLDALICVSSSGSSPNVVNAARYAKGIGAEVYTLTGFSKFNVLQQLMEDNPSRRLHVDSQKYGIVEDAHMAVLHATIEKIKRLMELP